MKRVKRSIGIDERPDAAAISRFIDKIDFDGPVTDPELGRCWLWTGHQDRHGYGQFRWDGRAHWANRIAYLIFNGPLTAGMHVAHKCNNSSCINPDHVFEDTIRNNIAERNRHVAAAARAEDEPPF